MFELRLTQVATVDKAENMMQNIESICLGIHVSVSSLLGKMCFGHTLFPLVIREDLSCQLVQTNVRTRGGQIYIRPGSVSVICAPVLVDVGIDGLCQGRQVTAYAVIVA